VFIGDLLYDSFLHLVSVW